MTLTGAASHSHLFKQSWSVGYLWLEVGRGGALGGAKMMILWTSQNKHVHLWQDDATWCLPWPCGRNMQCHDLNSLQQQGSFGGVYREFPWFAWSYSSDLRSLALLRCRHLTWFKLTCSSDRFQFQIFAGRHKKNEQPLITYSKKKKKEEWYLFSSNFN